MRSIWVTPNKTPHVGRTIVRGQTHRTDVFPGPRSRPRNPERLAVEGVAKAATTSFLWASHCEGFNGVIDDLDSGYGCAVPE